MKLLLDTHALIWALCNPKLLPRSLKKKLEDPENDCLFSAISALEIVVKIDAKKLEIEVEQILTEAKEIGFQDLPFLSRHAAVMHALPQLHSDPFDRALIAQASVEGLTFVTKDRAIQAYPIALCWE